MNGERKIIIVFAAIGLFVFSILYIIPKPTYRFTYFKLKSCPDICLTRIEYWRLGERGVAFTIGSYTCKSLPKNEAFINRNVDGFDSMYNMVVTCNDGKVIINYNSGIYALIGVNKTIFEKRVNATEFDSLLNNVDNLQIVGY